MQKNGLLPIFLIISTLLLVNAPTILTARASYVGEFPNLLLSYGFDENTGTNTYDWSGNGNTANIISATWNQAGYFNNSLTFADGGTYVNCTNDMVGYGLTDTWTITGWMYPTQVAAINTLCGDYDGANGLQIRIAAGGTQAVYFVYPNNHRITASYTFSANNWYFWVADANGTDMNLYINNTFAGTTSLADQDIGDTTATLKIGQRGDLAAGNNMVGRIDDFALFSRTLNDTERTLLFTNRYIGNLDEGMRVTSGVYPSDYVGANTFTVAQVTDTQFLAQNYNQLYLSKISSFINSQVTPLNIKMVVHTGDITQNGSDITQVEWANSTFAALTAPFVWTLGNHDAEWIGDSYLAFNPTTFSGKSYYVGASGDSYAVSFTYNSTVYLIVNLEYGASVTALAWATNLFNIYKYSPVILATHSFLNASGGYGITAGGYNQVWENNLYGVIGQYPNVFLTIAGHDDSGTTDATTSNSATVNGRLDTFLDRQSMHNNLGSCTVRFFEFGVMGNYLSLHVKTYDLLNEQYITDSKNDFSTVIALQLTPAAVTTTEQDLNWMAFIVLLVFALVNIFLILVPRLYLLNFVVGVLTLAFAAITVNDANLPVQPYFSLIVSLVAVLGMLRAGQLMRNS